ncbi:leucine--tRNA ligase, partial [Patescibacteria group bacterium]|nr:leucine--tRNA ligase [Patescibacteria group bacterium]
MVLAPEHELIHKLENKIQNLDEVKKYVDTAINKSDLERTDLAKEKTGIEMKGVKAINPVNNEEIPIWIADYVLISYGTGAIMAVPGHDQRDWDFATKFKLPIVEVIKGGDIKKEAFVDIEDGILVNSEQFDNQTVKVAINNITKWLEEKKLGKFAVNYKLRDWVFSRQRYWGEPIPIVECEKCGFVPLDEKELPLELPEVEKFQTTETGESPLANITEWVNVKCPKCKGDAKRETDTMPQWAGSSWYFLRYIDPDNDKALADKKLLKYWTPVDWYNGGMEHTTLHLLYSRFWNKFLFDIGAVPTSEPYAKRTSHGLILGEGGEKMSKSRGNVINPDDIVKEFGADTFRVYEMFMGPFDQPIPWDTKGVIGVRRFLEKVWRMGEKLSGVNTVETVNTVDKDIERLTHQTIKKVKDDIETQDYNTAVSSLMILANKFAAQKKVSKNDFELLLLLLSPFAPHICEELWEILGNKKSITLHEWPKYNEGLAKEEEIELVIQINGKVRDKVIAAVNITQEQAEELVKKSEKAKKYFESGKIKKVIFVPGKLINFVI